MAPTPRTTPAIQILENGPASVLTQTQVPVPAPGPGEVLVRNAFAGINFIDTYFRTGLYPTSLPAVLGREASGTVVSVNNPGSSSLQEGDRVVYMSGKSGTYAGYTAVPADAVLKLPEGMDLETAAAALLQGLTAWTFIREAANVQKGQWALVHAAAGGVGGLLVQMLHAVGAKVIGTAGSAEKCQLAKSYGADFVVQSRDKDVVVEVKQITGGSGVHVIFDGVGKATFDSDLQMIANKGTLIVFGNASGPVPPFDILKLGAKNVKLLRPVVNNYVSERGDLEGYSNELFELITSGKVKIGIHKVYPLSQAAAAHTDLEGRHTTGKLLLKCEQ